MEITSQLRRALMDAVDENDTLRGCGITILTVESELVVVRENSGPRRHMVLIVPRNFEVAVSPAGSRNPYTEYLPTPEDVERTIRAQNHPTIRAAPTRGSRGRQRPPAEPQRRFGNSAWDRYGPAAMSCSAAVATGVVIALSGGTASLFVGVIAVNSAALCGVNVGRAIAYRQWQEWEDAGGTAFTAWMTVETAMELVDLFGSVRGAVGALNAWQRADKLNDVRRVLTNRSLSRRQMVEQIRRIDPDFNPRLTAGRPGARYAGRAHIRSQGNQALNTHLTRTTLDSIASALTLSGADGTLGRAADLIMNHYDIIVAEVE